MTSRPFSRELAPRVRGCRALGTGHSRSGSAPPTTGAGRAAPPGGAAAAGSPALHWSKVGGDDGLSPLPGHPGPQALTAPALCPALQGQRTGAGCHRAGQSLVAARGSGSGRNHRALRPAQPLAVPAQVPPLASPPSNPEMQTGPHHAGAKARVQGDFRACTRVRSYMGARTLGPHCPRARNTHQAEGSSLELGALGMKPRSTQHRLGTLPSQLSSLGPASSITASHLRGL